MDKKIEKESLLSTRTLKLRKNNIIDKKIEKESLISTGILKLHKNNSVESLTTQEISNNSISSKEDTKAPLSPGLQPKLNFYAIYDILHGKFPEIINMDKPVLLAVGIRKEMSKKTGVSSSVLKRWIAWYCRKSNYYSKHKQGAIRFHLDGREAGIVSEQHQKNMDKKFEQTKIYKTIQALKKTSEASDNSLSEVN